MEAPRPELPTRAAPFGSARPSPTDFALRPRPAHAARAARRRWAPDVPFDRAGASARRALWHARRGLRCPRGQPRSGACGARPPILLRDLDPRMPRGLSGAGGSFRITVGGFPLEDPSRTLSQVGIAKDGPTVFVSRPREVRLGVNEGSEEDPEEELGAGAEWNRLGGEITVGQHASDHRRIEHER